MHKLTCKCGDKVFISTLPPAPCQGCDDCNTSFAANIENHKPLKPHKWQVMNNLDTGLPYKMCRECYFKDPETWANSQVRKNK